MNQYSRFSGAAVLVCLLASVPLVKAQPGTAGLYEHTATLLANGQVLVVGGNNGNFYSPTASARLYDPATDRWMPTGSLSAPRAQHSAVRLANGKVLVSGGLTLTRDGTGFFATAEIYDPATGVWSQAGGLGPARAGATATLLADGRVLVAGGFSPDYSNVDSVELYDPATGDWSPTGSMNSARSDHTATLLQSGQVLVVAGYNSSGSGSADVYDPVSGTWTATSSLIPAPTFTRAILLPGGQVLIAGGANDEGHRCSGVADAELYEAGLWSVTGSMIAARAYQSMTLLPDGRVLAAAGVGFDCDSLDSSEIYDPVSKSWSATGTLNSARWEHTATLLANGKVLVVGGIDSVSDSELYDPSTGRWSITGKSTMFSVSAASLTAGGTLAPESIAIAVGSNLAIATQMALPSLPLPTQLAGASVKVRDSEGVERLAPLFFVSPELINYLVPAGTAVGLANVTVTIGDNIVTSGPVAIARLAPGLFSADSTGSGVAAGFWIRVAEGGAQSQGYLFDPFTLDPVTLDLGVSGDQVYLSLYGTGFRGGSAAAAIVGNVSVPVSGFAPVMAYQGMDVVNIGPLPRALEGHGEVEVAFSVDGKAANLVKVNIR